MPNTVEELRQKYGVDYLIEVRENLLYSLKAMLTQDAYKVISAHIKKDANGQLYFTNDTVTINSEQYSMFDLMSKVVPSVIAVTGVHGRACAGGYSCSREYL